MAKYQVRADCFAYGGSKEKGCSILNALYCNFENCKFYKKNINDKGDNKKK